MSIVQRTRDTARSKLKGVGLEPDGLRTLTAWLESALHTPPVLVAGAGLTLNATGPGGAPMLKAPALWTTLQAAMHEELGEQAGNSSSALWMAELYERYFGRAKLERLLETAVPDQDLHPGPLHKTLARIPWEAIVTTNYDSLITRSYPSGAVRVACDDDDLPRSRTAGTTEIIHAHGSFSRPGGIVLTLESYRTFAAKRPATLAKLKQLFVQHPVLFIGFGAEDPNFVEWAGWVRDVASGRNHPWVSLDVGDVRRPESIGSYFAGLRFVYVGQPKSAGTKLLAVVEALAEAWNGRTVPLHRELALRLEEAANLDAVLQALESAVKRLAQEPLSPYSRKALCELAVQRLLALSVGSSSASEKDAETVWAQLEHPRSLGANPDSKARGSEGAELILLRSIIPGRWRYFLEMLTELDGSETPQIGAIQIDLRKEQVAAESPRLQLAIALLDLARETEDYTRARDSLLSNPPNLVSPEQLAAAVRVLDWQAGALVSAPEEPRAPEELRCCGHINWLRGSVVEAARFYDDAALKSNERDEPGWLQWLTVRSALTAMSVSRFGNWKSESSNLQRRMEQLHELERAIAGRYQHEVERWKDALYTAATDIVDVIHQGEVRRSTWLGESAPTDAARIVRLMEDNWIAPAIIAPVATLVGQARWYSDRRIQATRALCRYGADRELRALLDRENNRKRPGPLDDSIIALLSTSSELPSELASRLYGLSEIVSELKEIEPAVEQVNRGLALLKRRLRLLPNGGSTSEGIAPALVAATELAQVHGPACISKQLEQLLHDRGQATRSLVNGVVQLPWISWLRSGAVTIEVVERAWGQLWSRDELGTRDDLLNIALRARQSSVIEALDERLLGRELQTLAEETPTLDGRAWLRAAACQVTKGNDTARVHVFQLSALLAKRLVFSEDERMALHAISEHLHGPFAEPDKILDTCLSSIQHVLDRGKTFLGMEEQMLGALSHAALVIASSRGEMRSDVIPAVLRGCGQSGRAVWFAVEFRSVLGEEQEHVLFGHVLDLLRGRSATGEESRKDKYLGLGAVVRAPAWRCGEAGWWVVPILTLLADEEASVAVAAADHIREQCAQMDERELPGYYRFAVTRGLLGGLQDGRALLRAACVRALKSCESIIPEEMRELVTSATEELKQDSRLVVTAALQLRP